MPLALPIGLGLAARGPVDDVIRWANSARSAGWHLGCSGRGCCLERAFCCTA
jgi:hypothetical protein